MNFLNLKAVLSLNGAGFALGLKRSESQAKSFAKDIKSEFAKAFGTAAIVAYTAKLANMAGQIVETSDQLGISTKALQQWSHAAKQSGANIEDVTRYLEHLNLAREKATGGDLGAMQSFRNLGVSEQDLGTKSLEDLAAQIAATVASGDIQELSSSLRDIGGKGVSKLVPAMKDFADLSQQAKIISDEHLETLKAAADELQGMGATLGQSLIPYMAEFAKLASDGVSAITIGLGIMKSAMATLWRGGSLKDVWAAMNAAMDSGIDSWEARRKAIEERAAQRANRGGARVGGDIMHDQTPMERLKAVVERSAQGGSNRPSLTGWQSAGAAIRFNPDTRYLQDIATTNKAIMRNTDPKATSTRPAAIQDLGAGFS